VKMDVRMGMGAAAAGVEGAGWEMRLHVLFVVFVCMMLIVLLVDQSCNGHGFLLWVFGHVSWGVFGRVALFLFQVHSGVGTPCTMSLSFLACQCIHARVLGGVWGMGRKVRRCLEAWEGGGVLQQGPAWCSLHTDCNGKLGKSCPSYFLGCCS
jgi:hypothetical protein